MNCSEFQLLIPDIIIKNISDSQLREVIDHVENCHDCYDELEIYYVLKYGLSDDDSNTSMNFIGELEDNISQLKKRYKNLKIKNSVYIFIQIIANTSIIGALIFYVFRFLI